MFPICETRARFDKQVSRGRLKGLPLKAVARVEECQPYHPGHEWLGALDIVENVDKHRTLALTTTWAQAISTTVKDGSGQTLSRPTVVGTHVEDGQAVFSFPAGVFPEDITIDASASLFVAFKEPPSGDMNVVNALCREWLESVRHGVIPLFSEFLSSVD
jgi:hypothetical protein